jgi:hypothetical protein
MADSLRMVVKTTAPVSPFALGERGAPYLYNDTTLPDPDEELFTRGLP